MIFPFYIARRYLISKKSHNIINIIAGISVAGVTVGTMALIVVLSVFNGFEDLVKSLYSTFDPAIRITALQGKTFELKPEQREKILNIEGVTGLVDVIQENVLLKHKDEQYIVTMKGVSPEFLKDNPLDTMLVDGDFMLQKGGTEFTIMGYLVAYNLGARLFDAEEPVVVYVPRRGNVSTISPAQSFNTGFLIPSAVFSVQQEIDSKYILVSLDFARKMMEYDPGEITSVEVRLSNEEHFESIQNDIEKILGNNFEVKNRFQQQALLYKIMKSEKWAIFMILTFILIIAAFNVIGSLSMLILDKRKDIAVLFSLGADNRTIKKIFWFEGVLVSMTGALAGLLIGFLLCYAQQTFGLVKLGDANAFIVPYYPVKMMPLDFLLVFLTVFLIGLISAWYPVKQISSKYLKQRVSEFTRSQ